MRGFRIELDLLVELDDGAVELALLAEHDAAQHVEVAAARIEADGLVEIGDGFVMVLLGLIGRRAHEIGIRLLRIERHGLIQLGKGRIEIAGGGKADGAVAMGGDELVGVLRARGEKGGAAVEHLLDRALAGEARDSPRCLRPIRRRAPREEWARPG